MGTALTFLGSDTDASIDSINRIPQPGPGLPIVIHRLLEPVICIVGWAIDRAAGTRASAVIAEFEDGNNFPAVCGFGRSDVVEAYAEPRYAESGFLVAFPTERLALGKHAMTLRVVGAGERGFYRPHIALIIEIVERPRDPYLQADAPLAVHPEHSSLPFRSV